MRLSDMVARKIQRAIDNLPVLAVQKAQLDYECIPAAVQASAIPGAGVVGGGEDELITIFYISLFAPTARSIDDHVTFGSWLYDPYLDQSAVDRMIKEVHDKIVIDQDTQRREAVPEGLRQPEPTSKGGLILPR
jgi:hypothetical protein